MNATHRSHSHRARQLPRALLILLSLLLHACGQDEPAESPGDARAGGNSDATAAPPDAGPDDRADTEPDPARDSGLDATGPDATGPDASPSDASPSDAALPDAEPPVIPGAGDPQPAIAQCADAPLRPLSYRPDRCAHRVLHADRVEDIRPSCGAATPEPLAGLHVTFPDEDASRTLAVTWVTSDTNRVAEVRLGTSPDTLDRLFRGETFTYPTLTDRVVHEVHLCGLEPGRTYYYQAGGGEHWSETYSVATLPAPGSTDEIVLGITGDTRDITMEYPLWHEALGRLTEHGIDALVFTGDMVEIGFSQQQWDGWFAAGQPYLPSIPLIPCSGNHDLVSINYTGQLALPNDEENWTLRFGGATLVSVTDTHTRDPRALTGRTPQYMDDAFARNADSPWKFALNHRAYYSASNHGSQRDLQTHWLPIIERHRVDLVFNGHDHNYERTHPIRGDALAEMGRGTIYIIAAGVGAPLYNNGNEWWTHTSEKVSSYGILRIRGNRAEFTGHRLDGTVLDRFVWDKDELGPHR